MLPERNNNHQAVTVQQCSRFVHLGLEAYFRIRKGLNGRRWVLLNSYRYKYYL